ncbi:MAG: GyrI-like domain-containing protein [Desulfobacteraceae bacterium]|nr:GyrI-like domain-containing protein [Desulfobacteraceae bacterium]
MESRIEILKPKKLIGIHMEMSLSVNKTAELWQKFMPRRSEVTNRSTSEYISMQVYDKDQNNLFSSTTLFEKWAAVEVLSQENIPDDMEPYSLNGGKYAVFIHKGPADEFLKTMQHIFGSWLPESEYKLDNREHFEILPEGYSPIAPDAREEVWVPIK